MENIFLFLARRFVLCKRWIKSHCFQKKQTASELQNLKSFGYHLTIIVSSVHHKFRKLAFLPFCNSFSFVFPFAHNGKSWTKDLNRWEVLDQDSWWPNKISSTGTSRKTIWKRFCSEEFSVKNLQRCIV